MAKSISDEEIQLRKRARRRLVGAIALVTVMAVLLPMVLDHEPKPVSQDVNIQIPSPDAGVFTSKVVPLAPSQKSAPPPKTETAVPSQPAVEPPVAKADAPKVAAAPKPAAEAIGPPERIPKRRRRKRPRPPSPRRNQLPRSRSKRSRRQKQRTKQSRPPKVLRALSCRLPRSTIRTKPSRCAIRSVRRA